MLKSQMYLFFYSDMSTLTSILELERKNYHDTYNFILCNDYRVYVCHYEKENVTIYSVSYYPTLFYNYRDASWCSR